MRTLFMTFMWACPCAHTFGPYFLTASESGLKTDLGVVVVVILLLVIKFLSNWTAFVNFNVINIFRKTEKYFHVYKTQIVLSRKHFIHL